MPLLWYAKKLVKQLLKYDDIKSQQCIVSAFGKAGIDRAK